MRKLLLIFLALLCILCTAVTVQADSQNVTAACRFSCSTRGAKFDLVLRESNTSYIKLDADGWFALEWSLPVTTVWWQWNILPQRYTVQELDANGETLRTFSMDDEQIMRTWHVGDGVCGLRVQVEAPSSLCTLRAYTAEQAENANYLFEPVAQKAELMVFAAHPDDEFTMFGGLLPLYAGEEGRTTTVVYLANELVLRQREALHGLWHSKVKTYPIFLKYLDALPSTREAQLDNFGGLDAVTKDVVTLFRKYRPEVVVTHAIDGEYGHGAHIVISEAVRLAVTAAADPTQYPESAELYGVWQVKKLYLHLYPENTVLLDDNAPLAAFGGKSAMDVASECYAFHRSQREGWGNVMRSRKYDGAKYGLYASTVGPDTAGKNDLFEHIDEANAAQTAIPTQTPPPAATPEPTASIAPSAAKSTEPTKAAAETDAAVEADDASFPTWPWIAGGILLLAATALWLLRTVRQRKKKK